MNILSFLGTLLSSCLPLFLLTAGIYFLIQLSGFPLSHPIRILRGLFRDGDAASRRALFLSLAGTLGVGNIAGVGVALATGGEGAVFWLFVGGVAATVIKYAEITLSLDCRKEGKSGRGALDYIGPTLGRRTAHLFALLTIALSLLMGSLLQGSIIARAGEDLLPSIGQALTCALSVVTALLFLGGRRLVERVTGLLIPLLTLLYCSLAAYIVFANITSLPSIVLRILNSAFSFRSAGGGLLGAGIVQAMRAGIGKGLFSNEAGAGTAPFAHGSATVHPAREGLYGVLEVAIDTLFMCTLTALAVLSCFDTIPTLSGTALVSAAFAAVFGQAAGMIVSLSVILFSYATVACWISYGQCALAHLSPSRPLRLFYGVFFSLALPLGAHITEGNAFLLCDITLAAMTFINTAALLKSTSRIRRLSNEYLLLQVTQSRR